jgi:putative oxidoreductase
MPDIVILLSRILMSAVFIVYGSLKFMDVTTIINNAGTKRFMDLVASGAAAPTWLGYLIAAIELLGGLAILIGVKTRWVAALLVLWLIIVTAVGHPFWTMEGAARSWEPICSSPSRARAGTRSIIVAWRWPPNRPSQRREV